MRSSRVSFAGSILVLVATGCATGNENDGLGGGFVATGAGGASSSSSSASASSTGQGTSQASTTASTVSASSNASTGTSPAGTLFFSEYVEGSNNNKALEIVNAGPTPTPLGGCRIDRYQNGAIIAGTPELPLDDVMLGPNETFVICNDLFGQLALCDQTSNLIQHSGDDVVALHCADGDRDFIGTIGDQTIWGISPTTTQDATLRRKCSVTAGDTVGTDPFDPSIEWDGFSADAFADLGMHVCP
jgi:uncharacterized protein